MRCPTCSSRSGWNGAGCRWIKRRWTLRSNWRPAAGVQLRLKAQAQVQTQAQAQVRLRVGLVPVNDERGLRWTMLKLVSNTIKCGRKNQGPQWVVLSAEAAPQAVRLHRVDHGDGMTPEQWQRQFRPFERPGQEGSSQPGSVLGPVITRPLAQVLGGAVSLHSPPGGVAAATPQLPRG